MHGYFKNFSLLPQNLKENLKQKWLKKLWKLKKKKIKWSFGQQLHSSTDMLIVLHVHQKKKRKMSIYNWCCVVSSEKWVYLLTVFRRALFNYSCLHSSPNRGRTEQSLAEPRNFSYISFFPFLILNQITDAETINRECKRENKGSHCACLSELARIPFSLGVCLRRRPKNAFYLWRKNTYDLGKN